MKISVIVPVYNSEKTIENTLLALKAQTFEKFETIIVNNCSTDATEQICRNFCDQDNRFNYVYTDVKGVSNARNIGLSHAKGEYICFCDADDIPEKRYLEVLYEDIIHFNTDCVMCNYFTERDNCESSFRGGMKGLLSRSEIREKLIPAMFDTSGGEAAVWGTVWRCIFSRQLIIQHEVKFDDGLTFAEDACFLLEYMHQCNSIYLETSVLYRYVMTEGSAMLSYCRYKPQLAAERIHLIMKLRELLENYGVDPRCNSINTIFQEYILECVGNAASGGDSRTFSQIKADIKKIIVHSAVREIFQRITTDNLKHKIVFYMIRSRKALLLTLYYWVRRRNR